MGVVVVDEYHHHLEGACAETAMHVGAAGRGRAENRAVANDPVGGGELQWNGDAGIGSGYGIPDHGKRRLVEEEDKAVAAADEAPALVEARRDGEALVELPRHREELGGDAIGRVQRRSEGWFPEVAGEEAEEGRGPVVDDELGEELGVGDDASPPLADERGAEEGGRPRREAEDDLVEDVVAEIRELHRGPRRGVAAALRRLICVRQYLCLRSRWSGSLR